MGITVHFEMTAAADATAAPAKQIVSSLYRIALNFKREGFVDDVLPIASDLKTLGQFACDWNAACIRRGEFEMQRTPRKRPQPKF